MLPATRASGHAEFRVNSKPHGNRTLRIGVPAAILLGGLALASLFPRERGPGQEERPRAPIVYRRQPAPPAPEQALPVPPVDTVLKANPFAANRPATVLQPIEREPPLPRLTKTFPREDMGASPRWGISMGLGLTSGTAVAARSHRIVDGDTLPDLAQRYLGDKTRALEIFEANRHILPTPEILPIGQEIRIPGPVRAASAFSEASAGANPPAHPNPARAPTRPALSGLSGDGGVPSAAGGAATAAP